MGRRGGGGVGGHIRGRRFLAVRRRAEPQDHPDTDRLSQAAESAGTRRQDRRAIRSQYVRHVQDVNSGFIARELRAHRGSDGGYWAIAIAALAVTSFGAEYRSRSSVSIAAPVIGETSTSCF